MEHEISRPGKTFAKTCLTVLALQKTGRVFYGACLMTIGMHQLFYADFRTVILPPWPSWRTTSPAMLASATGITLVVASILIMFSSKGKRVALIVGATLLAVVVLWHLPYVLFVQPNKIRHLGLWAEASKALALAGGAFVVAGTWPRIEPGDAGSTLFSRIEKLIPYGRIFFSITMTEFGIDHFLYTDHIATMVPNWIPWHTFWTYLTGVALIGSGTAVAFSIMLKPVALLQGLMIFLWFVFLHVPGAIAHPDLDSGNLIVSAADALGFSGTALIIGSQAPSPSWLYQRSAP